MADQTLHPIQDKAQVGIDFPDKFYLGSFSRDARFEARSENDGLMIKLMRSGAEKRQAEVHIHHHLLADILTEWAVSLRAEPPMSASHRDTLLEALSEVSNALRRDEA